MPRHNAPKQPKYKHRPAQGGSGTLPPPPKNGTPDGPNVFRPEEQLLYHYWDGETMRHADPLVLYRRVMDVRGELAANMSSARVPNSKFSADAHAGMIKQIRDIFGLKPFDEGTQKGLTEGSCCALLDHFLDWADSLKKNTPNSPTSPETTSPTTPESSGESPATSTTAGSGSTGSESRTDAST